MTRTDEASKQGENMEEIMDGLWREQPVVRRAVRFWIANPDESPLAILDAAMDDHYDRRCVAFDWMRLRPPHPFGELVRQAFAPGLSQVELWLALSEQSRSSQMECMRAEWELAVCRFEAHYRISAQFKVC